MMRRAVSATALDGQPAAGPPRGSRAWLPVLRLSPLAACLLAAPAAIALEEQKGEEAAITDCDKRLCAMLLERNPQGGDLKCALTKTWAKSKIKHADNSKVSWGFGDARCTVEVNLSRAKIVAVLGEKGGTYRVPPHTAHCVVEQDGKLEKVTAVVAPKIVFRNGRAEQIWINLKSIDGPSSITYTLQLAAQLADTFGLFHHQMIKSINRYIERHCPTTQAVAAQPPPAGKEKASK
ncbi:MAG: hypothetical protein J2P50_08250 [Hyphomicrobiaceae bacterium]|nr:hypothetical protein [Hyphomicrobiaceae bacterium]